MQSMQLTTAQSQYLNWLRQYDPGIYAVLNAQLSMNNTLGAVEPQPTSNWFNTLADNLSNGIKKISATVEQVLPTYQAYKINSAEIQLQTERLKKGLPPQPTAAPTNNPPPRTAQQQDAIENIATLTLSPSPQWGNAIKNNLPLILGGSLLYMVLGKK